VSEDLDKAIIDSLRVERDKAREDCGVQRVYAKTFAWERDNFIRRALLAEAKVAAVLELCDSFLNSQTPLWPSQIRLAIEEAAQMGGSTDAADTTRPYAAVNDQQGETP